MKSIFYTLTLSLLILGCNKDSGNNSTLFCEGAVPDQLNVRILNTSSYDVKEFNYDNIQTFNSILSGELTSYMQLENSLDAPSFREMTIEGKLISLQLIDPLGLRPLEPGCYTYLLHAYQYGDGEFITGGRIYGNDILNDFDPINEDCLELETSDCNPQSDKTNIRLKNSTAYDFCNVELDMNNQDHAVYGNLASGESSCYISFDKAKEYPLSCKFLLGNKEYVIENPSYHESLDELTSGFYTYNISLIRATPQQAHIQISNN